MSSLKKTQIMKKQFLCFMTIEEDINGGDEINVNDDIRMMIYYVQLKNYKKI